jgi:hypothetical protein
MQSIWRRGPGVPGLLRPSAILDLYFEGGKLQADFKGGKLESECRQRQPQIL